MAQWALASTTDADDVHGMPTSSLDLGLSSFHPNYDPASALEANCPMCRTHTAATPDRALDAQLEARYPRTYQERKADKEVARGIRTGSDGGEGVLVLIGNRHQLEADAGDGNAHDWTFFVRVSRPELVDRVVVELHPTFRRHTLVLREAPFEVRRLGWGTFVIQAEIWLKSPWQWMHEGRTEGTRALELEWELDFHGRGRQGRVQGRVRRGGGAADAGDATAGRVLRNRTLPQAPT